MGPQSPAVPRAGPPLTLTIQAAARSHLSRLRAQPLHRIRSHYCKHDRRVLVLAAVSQEQDTNAQIRHYFKAVRKTAIKVSRALHIVFQSHNHCCDLRETISSSIGLKILDLYDHYGSINARTPSDYQLDNALNVTASRTTRCESMIRSMTTRTTGRFVENIHHITN